MGSLRSIPFILALCVLGAEGADPPSAVDTRSAISEDSVKGADASRVILPCIPVGTYWAGPPPSDTKPPGPGLAVVAIDVRPKNARVYLDGRLVGRARYLDGRPGYLYLEPGSYVLELQAEGYRRVLVELDASASCRYDIKHRLERFKGVSEGGSEKAYGKGKPVDRVYGPLEKEDPAAPTKIPSGPDPSLRKDLDRRSKGDAAASEKPTASLRLQVSPESASVEIDGVFVATARELKRMERPLATTAGEHRLVVRADGFVTASREIELVEGEILEIEISLSENRTN